MTRLADLAPEPDDPLVLRGCAGCGRLFALPYPQPIEPAGKQEPFWCAKCLARGPWQPPLRVAARRTVETVVPKDGLL